MPQNSQSQQSFLLLPKITYFFLKAQQNTELPQSKKQGEIQWEGGTSAQQQSRAAASTPTQLESRDLQRSGKPFPTPSPAASHFTGYSFPSTAMRHLSFQVLVNLPSDPLFKQLHSKSHSPNTSILLVHRTANSIFPTTPQMSLQQSTPMYPSEL